MEFFYEIMSEWYGQEKKQRGRKAPSTSPGPELSSGIDIVREKEQLF